MITREQVADLREGDVVELSGHPSQFGSTTRGPLYERDGELYVGDRLVRYVGGSVNHTYADRLHLTVVSRAPRPLYVNSDRTEPVPGDIVRDVDGDAWQYKNRRWHLSGGSSPIGVEDISNCSPLTLLWDGTTGQVVPDAAEGWAEGFEAAAEWLRANPGPTGIPHDPPSNPYETGQVVPS